jgi:hypothetical protein
VGKLYLGAASRGRSRLRVESQNKGYEMRFRIDVNTLDGKLSFQKDTAADAVAVAKGAKESLGVTVTDTADGITYAVEDFDKLLRKA